MLLTPVVDISTKADKVLSAVANDVAGLDSGGNLIDTGHQASEIGGGGGSGTTLTDGTYLSVDGVNRQLIATDGTTVIGDWKNTTGIGFQTPGICTGRLLTFGAGIDQGGYYSVDVENRQLSDSSVNALDWGNRTLIANDGETAAIDWHDPNGTVINIPLTFNGQAIFGGNGLQIYLGGGENPVIQGPAGTIDFSIPAMQDQNGVASIYWNARQLSGPDGSTIAADWSDGTLRDGSGNAFSTSAGGSVPNPLAFTDTNFTITTTPSNPGDDYFINLNGVLIDENGSVSLTGSLDGASYITNVLILTGTNEGTPSIDVTNRQLYTPENNVIADWSGANNRFSCQMDFQCVGTAYIGNQLNNINDNTWSIDVNNRQLIASDGNTVAADWSSPYEFTVNYDLFVTGSMNVSSYGINFADGSTQTTAYLGGGGGSGTTLTDGTNLSVDGVNRQLIGSDGTTILADWNSTAQLNVNKLVGIIQDPAGSWGLDLSYGYFLDHTGTPYLGIDQIANLVNSFTVSAPTLPDYSAVTSPIEGMVAWNYTTHVFTTYNGTTWI